jgi:hypothetical protein
MHGPRQHHDDYEHVHAESRGRGVLTPMARDDARGVGIVADDSAARAQTMPSYLGRVGTHFYLGPPAFLDLLQVAS